MDILSFFSKKRSALVFSILCGLSYLGIVSKFVLDNTNTGGGLLLIFFFPAIICGGALFIYKAIQTYLQTEARSSLNMLFWGHIIVILLSIALVIEMIIF